jgi:putative transposase
VIVTLPLRGCLQSNGSQSARQRLRQVSGKERRRLKDINHETSKAINRINAGKRTRARHCWAWRQSQTFG